MIVDTGMEEKISQLELLQVIYRPCLNNLFEVISSIKYLPASDLSLGTQFLFNSLIKGSNGEKTRPKVVLVP